jgi:hypothetical protein
MVDITDCTSYNWFERMHRVQYRFIFQFEQTSDSKTSFDICDI